MRATRRLPIILGLAMLLAVAVWWSLTGTRNVVVCPPPGIEVKCTSREVHIWQREWWNA